MRLKKLATALLLISSTSLTSMTWADVTTGLAAYYDNDLDRSYAEFVGSAQNNNATAAFLVGMLLMDENFSQANLAKAEEWLKKAVDQGSAEAAYNLAYFYLNNTLPNGTKENYQKYLEKAQSLNLMEAFLLPMLTAEIYENRFGEPDDVFMLKSLLKAHQIEQTPFTEFGIGTFLLLGDDYIDVDLTQLGLKIQHSNVEDGVMYLEKALNSGLLLALLPLSSVYKGEIKGYPANSAQSQKVEKILEEKFFQIMADMIELKNVQPISIYSMQSDDERQKMIKNLMAQSKTDGNAAERLGNLYLSGAVTGKSDSEQAQYYYFQAVSLGKYSLLKKIYDEARYDADVQRKMVPFIEQAVAQSDPYGLYFMGLMYINGIQSDYGYDDRLAALYLKKAASLGNIDALKALAYERVNNLSIRDHEQLQYAKQLIELAPNDQKPYLIVTRTLMRTDLANAYDEIYGYVQKIDGMNPNDPELLSLMGDFYGTEGRCQDGAKAIGYYDRLIDLEASEMYSAKYRFEKALLLKNGAVNLAKDEKAALEILLTLSPDYVGRELYNTLGEMYHYGKGTAVDIPKAIEHYKKGTRKILLPLGKLLLASQDIEQRNDGAYYIIQEMQDEGAQQEYETLLLANTDLDFVQQWLLNIYHDQDIVKGQQAYQLIKKGYEAGIPRMQLNYAEILSRGNEAMKKQGEIILEQLVAQDYVPALRKKFSDFSFTDAKERLPYAKKIAEITGSDADLQELAEIYNRLEAYDLAMAVIEKIQDQERSFLSFRRDDAKKGLQKLQDLRERADKKDPDAWYQLVELAKKQGNNDEQIILLKRAMENGSSKAMQDFGMILIHKGDDNNLMKGRELLLKSIRLGNVKALEPLYQLYSLDIDPRITRKEMSDLMFELKYSGIAEAEEYFKNFVHFDVAEEFLITSEKGSKEYISALGNIVNMYRDGNGTKQNTERYIETLKELSEYDDGDAAYALGQHYESLDSNETNIQTAAFWYKKANEKNYSNAGGRVIEWNDLIQKAKSGDLDAKFALLAYKQLEENPVDMDAQLKALVKQNHNGARVMLAKNLLKQPRYEDHYVQALVLLKAAINNGSEYAATILAETLMNYQYDPEVKDVNAEIESVLLKYPTDDNNKLLVNYFIQNKNFEHAYAVIEKLPKETQLGFYQGLYDLFVEDQDATDYQAAMKAADKILGLYPSEGNYRIGRLYLFGDQTLTVDRVKALSLLASAFDQMMAEILETNRSFYPDFSYVDRKFETIYENLLEGNQNEQALGVQWLQQLAQYNMEDAAKVLMNYYKEHGDYLNAYLYGSAYGFWEINNIEDRLNATQIETQKAKAKVLKDSFQYIQYIGEVNQWKKRAEENSAHAFLRLGEIYQQGKMAAKDTELAIQYYEKAGQNGESFAYNRLGNMYRKGDGVPTDSAKAVYYFDLGAQNGDSNCAHQAGDVLYFGENNISKDFVKAAEYFDMTDLAQGKHHVLAKYKLAYIYYHGSGDVVQDKKRAYEILKQYESSDNQDIHKALVEWDFSNI
ncbi:SEL1-like repeat protein [Wohlfahrtiimonas larvae]|uniref:Sel1 repeat family protein n=1 Tax=Wohlfahrtiimonas larvae TaxID=1157986 RepID=A0ABP9MQX8_9GAMM|nr:SEL1-like repeat protein [Wohlfahrtiimonas larvae]